jgi:hypothetical protein
MTTTPTTMTLRDLSSRVGALRARAEDFLLTRQLATYGVALGRILGGTAYLGILITNFPARSLLFGPASDWAQTYRDNSEWTSWIGLLENLGGFWFTAFYLGAIALGVAFVLGWYARLTGALFLFGCIQILQMDPLVSDQGDNILRVGILLLLLTECSAVWSLDARRRARDGGRAGTGSRPAAHPALRTARTLLHNGAVIALAANLVTIYISAAMYKIPGNGWRMGTAIAYPLDGDEYRVWPMLNDLVVHSWFLVFVFTYGAIYLQLYFPALLLNKVTRRFALVSVACLHLGIAVLMGLPWFSLAMMAFDGIFVRSVTYQAVERFVRARLARGVRG